MQVAGLAFRDVGGYEWHGNHLRPTHHKELRDWRARYGTPWLTYSIVISGADAGCGFRSFPEGFECYDVFQKEPVLFAIAAQLWVPREKGDLDKKAIMEFANKWGEIADDPKECGSDLQTWYANLDSICWIAQKLKQPVPMNPRAAKKMAEQLRSGLLNINLACDVITVPSGLQSRLMVIGLTSSLRVQATEAVVDGWVLRHCENCTKPIAADLSREDRRYCSDSCRVQAYKKRRRKALELDGKGKTIIQIAAAVDTDVKTVRGWIKQQGK